MNLNTEPSKELRAMLRHLLEMMPASNVSGPGRDSAINLLVKQVPRKSLKNPDNSLTLWVIDQGMKHILHVGKHFIKPWWIPTHALPLHKDACLFCSLFYFRKFVTDVICYHCISIRDSLFSYRPEEDLGSGWDCPRDLRRATSYRQQSHELLSLAEQTLR